MSHPLKRLRRFFFTLCGLLVAFAIILAGVITFGTQAPPPPLAAVLEPAIAQARAQRGSLTPLLQLKTRDGSVLAYRRYEGRDDAALILIHGSTGSAEGMHAMAQFLNAENGATIYALDMRGHGESGRLGDIDFIGQMEQDLADLIASLPAQQQSRLGLIGFSAGGGFALRVAGSDLGQRFERILLLAPMLHPRSPTYRTEAGSQGNSAWAVAHLPRLIALAVLDGFGIAAFQHLPVLAFARYDAQGRPYTYSYRLWANFKAHEDYAGDYRRQVRAPILLVGANDQLFNAAAYEPELQAIRSDAVVRVLPGIDHMGLSLQPAAFAAIRAELQGF